MNKKSVVKNMKNINIMELLTREEKSQARQRVQQLKALTQQKKQAQASLFEAVGIPAGQFILQKSIASQSGQKFIGQLKAGSEEYGDDLADALNKIGKGENIQKSFKNVGNRVHADAQKQIDALRGQAEDKVDNVKTQVEDQINTTRSDVEGRINDVRSQAESRISEARNQAENIKNEAESRVGQARNEVEGRINDVRSQAENRMNQARSEAENIKNQTEDQLNEVRNEVRNNIEEPEFEDSPYDLIDQARGNISNELRISIKTPAQIANPDDFTLPQNQGATELKDATTFGEDLQTTGEDLAVTTGEDLAEAGAESLLADAAGPVGMLVGAGLIGYSLYKTFTDIFDDDDPPIDDDADVPKMEEQPNT